MTDLVQQAREMLAAQYNKYADKQEAKGYKKAAENLRQSAARARAGIYSIPVAAFRAAQPVEGNDAASKCPKCSHGSLRAKLRCDECATVFPLPLHPDPDASLPGHNPLREALIMAAHLAPGVTRTGSEAERIADAALPLFDGEEEVVRPDREAVARVIDPPAWSGRNHKSDEWRRTHTLKKADAILALLPAEPVQEMREPVAVIGKDWSLLWASPDALSKIVERTGITIGSKLYAALPSDDGAREERGGC